MLTLVVMTDGRRDCLTRSIESMTNLSGSISVRMIHDDSGDVDYTEWLWDTFGDRWTIHSTDHRSGFAGAYRSMWKWIRDHDRNPYVLSTEDDFVFTREVNLADMAGVLRRNPYLVQMALRLLRAPAFYFGAASQAAVGGYSSAPVVAEIYQPGLAPVGLLLAVVGNVLGTYVGLAIGQLLSALR